jgi:tRNA-Thr(GGU) m(6)t(6)A37 methyltransferase TsaA
MSAKLTFIGHIQTPYMALKDCPNNIQFDGPSCKLNLNSEYQNELQGLNEGQNILILYWLGNPDRTLLTHKPKRDKDMQGTFSLRTPIRQNPIGVAVLPIEKIEHGQVSVKGLDCLNDTQLLDIKPATFLEATDL